MLTTDCKFLENELMDVVRLFEKRPTSICHTFRFEDGEFYPVAYSCDAHLAELVTAFNA